MIGSRVQKLQGYSRCIPSSNNKSTGASELVRPFGIIISTDASNEFRINLVLLEILKMIIVSKGKRNVLL